MKKARRKKKYISMRHALSTFRHLEKKRQLLIFFLLTLVFFLGAGVSGYLRWNTPGRKGEPTQQTTPRAIASLAVDPSASLRQGDSFSVSLILDSSGLGVEAADFVISFDPTYVTPQDIIPGSYFGLYPRARMEPSRIKLSGMAGMKDNAIIIPKGKGTVATFRFLIRSPVSHTIIGFDPQLTVIAAGGKNITGTLSPVSVRLYE